MSRPLIGIATRFRKFEGADTPFNGVFDSYVSAITAAGGNPILIPIGGRPEDAEAAAAAVSGLVLTGGEDIDPVHFGEPRHPSVTNVSAERDKFDMKMIEYGLKTGTPLLALCRGMQVANVVCGGTLIQDLPSAGYTAVPHKSGNPAPSELAHELSIEPDSKLAAILGTTSISINSRHHQAPGKIGTGLRSSAHAGDGVVEALEMPSHPFFLGVIGHPEDLWNSTEPRWANLFRAFVEHSAKRAQ